MRLSRRPRKVCCEAEQKAKKLQGEHILIIKRQEYIDFHRYRTYPGMSWKGQPGDFFEATLNKQKSITVLDFLTAK